MPIPQAASEIHHVTDEMMSTAPRFADVLPELEQAIGGRRLVIYNARYDTAVLDHELARYFGLDAAERAELPEWWHARGVRPECAMLACSDFEHEWSSFREDWRWPELGNDAADAHRAGSDCRTTLERLRFMAADSGATLGALGSGSLSALPSIQR